MLGAPEVKISLLNPQGNPPVFKRVKKAVDENASLKAKLETIKKKTLPMKKKLDFYNQRIVSATTEIENLANLLRKYLGMRGKPEQILSKVFSEAQINLLMGKKKVVWSHDDMAMAFTLRHVGNRESYLYLKDILNIPLPSLSSVQRWVASNNP